MCHCFDLPSKLELAVESVKERAPSHRAMSVDALAGNGERWQPFECS